MITVNHPGNSSGCKYYERLGVTSFHQFAIDPKLQGRGLGAALLADLMMPVMTGRELLETLNLGHPEVFDEVATFIWTAKGSDGAELKSLPRQFDTLRKPVDLNELLKAVEKHCGRPG